ncbi:hypothetical protein TWF694_011293 [Orbilia ellipsospora]|uniref:Uncharacterized protein n=1 Tax=Orbilia ellipsospora TaxID=2528407 RepID=A0AAV9XB12_9PEZI
MGNSWSFSFSFWIVNGIYESDRNVTAYRLRLNESEPIIIEQCGPSNLISAGYALWLVLIPAVACISQLPGSTFLSERSNFYRFSPELGIVETLNIIVLVIKGLLSGFGWHQSVLGVFVVREGIGNGDLWWRRDLSLQDDVDDLYLPNENEETSGEVEPASENIASEEVDIGYPLGNLNAANANTVTNQPAVFTPTKLLKRRMEEMADPLSTERVLGVALFAI